MPRLAKLSLIFWSSIEVYIRLCWLSNGLSCGVASRMDFITMFMNSDSNCWAAARSASGESCLPARRSAGRSAPSVVMRGFWLIMRWPVLAWSNDFQFGAQ